MNFARGAMCSKVLNGSHLAPLCWGDFSPLDTPAKSVGEFPAKVMAPRLTADAPYQSTSAFCSTVLLYHGVLDGLVVLDHLQLALAFNRHSNFDVYCTCSALGPCNETRLP